MKLTSEILEAVLSDQFEYRPQEFREFKSVSSFLQQQIKLKNYSKKSLLVSIDIPESVGYKYIDGSRAVSRDIFLKFLIAFGFELNDVQFLLINFGYGSLFIRNKRDSAIIHGLVNNYSYLQLKHYLIKHDLNSL